MIMRFLIILTISLCPLIKEAAAQQTKNAAKVIVKYKQYESFDLGNLEIEGKVIAPGDLTVKERNRKKFYRDLYVREDFDPEVRNDIENLR